MFRVLKIMDQFAFACMFMSCFLANWLRTGIIFGSWIIIYFLWNGRFLFLKYTSCQPKQLNFAFDSKKFKYLLQDYKEQMYDSSNTILTPVSLQWNFHIIDMHRKYIICVSNYFHVCWELIHSCRTHIHINLLQHKS